jgi:hypothetical protein
MKVREVARWHLDQSASVAEIVATFGLTPAEVHAALSYYYDHEDELRAQIAENDNIEATSRRENPSTLRAKLGKPEDWFPD